MESSVIQGGYRYGLEKQPKLEKCFHNGNMDDFSEIRLRGDGNDETDSDSDMDDSIGHLDDSSGQKELFGGAFLQGIWRTSWPLPLDRHQANPSAKRV